MRNLKAALLAVAMALPLAGRAADPGVFTIPGTDSTIKFYGYVQLDSTYDASGRIGDIENYDYATIVAIQPLKDTAAAKDTGKVYLTGRTSRFGVQTNTPSDLGPVEAKLEFDFNGPNGYQGQTYTNSMLFRLRHAYGKIGGLLVGQTWTNFLDLPSYPDVVDFNGPGSIALIRQPQVRYTLPLGAAALSFSAENARNGGVGYLPDFTAKLAYAKGPATFGLGLVTNQYRYTGTGASSPNDKYKQGFGAALSGSVKVLGQDTIVAHAVGGEGLGRYLFNNVASIGDRFLGVNSQGEVTLWRSYAYHLGYTHVWNGKFRSNLVWSQTFFDKNGIDLSGAPTTDDESKAQFVPNKRIDQLFVNTFWTVTKNAEVGVEYEYGRRHTFDKQTGNQDRVTATVHYNFF